MALGALREKQLVRWSGRVLRLDGRLTDGEWQLTELSSGLIDKQSDTALLAAVESGNLVFIERPDAAVVSQEQALLNALSEAARAVPDILRSDVSDGGEGALKFEYVKVIHGLSQSAAKKAIQSAWEKLKRPKQVPGYSTVMGWRLKCQGRLDPIAALQNQDSKKGRRGYRYCEEVVAVLRKVRDDHYLNKNPRITVQKATKIAQDKIRILNAARPRSEHLPIPKRKAFLAVVRELDAAEVIAARHGADAALSMLRTSLGGVKTTRPLERVEIDHTVLSIILLDDDYEPLGRAFTTVAKDANTRAILGYYWGAESPSIVSLARCIRHSIQPKIEFLKEFPSVVHQWNTFGVAESWVIDNGLEEFASALHQAASEQGVQKIEFCGRRSPWHKPNIERHFRTQDQDLIHGLPGTTMENIMRRTDFDPKKDILIRWSSFERIYVKWIVDVYMQAPQKILKNRSPSQAWKDKATEFTQFLPDSTTVLECLFLRAIDGRTLDHAGVEFDRLVYNSRDMGLIRRKLGPKLKVNIRVDDEDLSYLYVQVPGHNVWVKVDCLDQDYACGLTRWQHDKCKRMQRACLDEGSELSLAEAREQIRSDVDAERREVKQGRRKARARMHEKPKGGGRNKGREFAQTEELPAPIVQSERSHDQPDRYEAELLERN